MSTPSPQSRYLSFLVLSQTIDKISCYNLLLQGWFEPDDDETCRAKAKEFWGFGEFPKAVVFDKIDLLGPSAHPLYAEITKYLPTPNGYGRITMNYEKFLLDANGKKEVNIYCNVQVVEHLLTDYDNLTLDYWIDRI